MFRSQAMKPQRMLLCGRETLSISRPINDRTQGPSPGRWPT